METLQKIRVPGVVWAVLLVAAAWFLQANWPDEAWMPLALIVITAIVKTIEVRLVDLLPPSVPAPPSDPQVRDADTVAMAAVPMEPVDQHRIRRWLIA